MTGGRSGRRERRIATRAPCLILLGAFAGCGQSGPLERPGGAASPAVESVPAPDATQSEEREPAENER